MAKILFRTIRSSFDFVVTALIRAISTMSFIIMEANMQSTLATVLEQFITELSGDIRGFVKDNDRFLQHRHGLVQKETSISVLKGQNWDEVTSRALQRLEEAVAEEFSLTETSRKSLEFRRHNLTNCLTDVQGYMMQLLKLYNDLRSCLNGSKVGKEPTVEPEVNTWKVPSGQDQYSFASVEGMYSDDTKKSGKTDQDGFLKTLMDTLGQNVPNLGLRDQKEESEAKIAMRPMHKTLFDDEKDRKKASV